MTLMLTELSDQQFIKISKLVYQLCGIHLKSGKEALVRARLMKRLRSLNLKSFDEYLKLIESKDGIHELGKMIDVISTNKTSFFREQPHFNYLRETLLPNLKAWKLRFWIAACSSGEEAYSLAITLLEHLDNIDSRDVKILATDISTIVLAKARQGIYTDRHDLPPGISNKYFTKISDAPPTFQITQKVREIVRIARLNLIEKWPMQGPFDVIFCRNVMIYFDRGTQERLVNRLWELLGPDGHLFVGHSEGLSAIKHKFHYVGPAIYKK